MLHRVTQGQGTFVPPWVAGVPPCTRGYFCGRSSPSRQGCSEYSFSKPGSSPTRVHASDVLRRVGPVVSAEKESIGTVCSVQVASSGFTSTARV